MAITEFSKNYHEKMFPEYQSSFFETDVMIPAALNFGVTPVEIKEIVYQSAASATGNHNHGKPQRGRNAGTGGYFWRRDEGFLEIRS